MVCPDDETLACYAEGVLLGKERVAVEEHLDKCGECKEVIAAFISAVRPRGRDSVKTRRNGPGKLATELVHSIDPSPGTAIGRYLLLQRIGGGAMGDVYAAFDPELDRKIALKLLRPDRVGSSPDEPNRVRLLREAQGMARLSHPNVIAVHDVQTFDGEIAIAMEFVDGVTLRVWKNDTQPTWRQCLDVYSRAGQGIAAAHKAGLVHRDFKPDNVLLGKDGRVRVTDFGLVRQATELQLQTDTGLTEKGRRAAPPRVSLDTSLTQTGAVLGTPAYMAPEQLLGKEVDARSDQYSFCVALYEALYGERPYTAKSFEELRQKTISGVLPPPPRDRHVPAWLRNAVVRGLSKEPDKRYPSMTALLAALQQDPAKRLRRRLIAGGAIAAAAVVAGLVVGLRGGGVSCEVSPEEFAGVWDDGVKTRVAAAFLATGAESAGDTFERAANLVDAHVDSWARIWSRSCADTHERGVVSQRTLDQRTTCLRRHRESLRILTGFLTADLSRTIVNKSIAAILALPRLENCYNASIDQSPPKTPAASLKSESIRHKLQQAEILENLGRYSDARQFADSVIPKAKEYALPELLAQAIFIVGKTQFRLGEFEAAEKSLRQAAHVAVLANRIDIYLEASAQLAFTIGSLQERFEEAALLGDHLATSLDPWLAKEPASVAQFLHVLGSVYAKQGEYEKAKATLLRAARIWERIVGPDHPSYGASLHNYALVLLEGGALEAARRNHEKVVQIYERAFGPTHPRVAAANANLALVLGAAGRHEDAQQLLQRSIRIFEQELGAEHPYVGSYVKESGFLFLKQGLYDRALNSLERALSLTQNAWGAQHSEAGVSHLGLGQLYLARQQLDKSIRHLEKAAAILVNKPSEATKLARTRFMLARTLWMSGERDKRPRTLAVKARDYYAAVRNETLGNSIPEIDAWISERYPRGSQ